MLLIEELRWRNADPAAERVLAEAVVIKVDNIAEFYWTESPQEVWDLTTDFPNMAPPWPVAFYEFRLPRVINSEGHVRPNPSAGVRAGVLIMGEPVTAASLAANRLARAKYMAYQSLAQAMLREMNDWQMRQALEGVSADDVWARLGAAKQYVFLESADSQVDVYEQQEIRWGISARVYMQVVNGPPVACWEMTFPLTRTGRIPLMANGRVPVAVACLRKGYSPSPAEADGAKTWLHVPLLAISFTHCKNVMVEDHVPSDKLIQRSLQRRGVPKVTYKTLIIQPMREVLQREGGMAHGNSAQKALHICRGHFADYRERGLFGKHHGVYWIDMHVRGQRKDAVVLKDYAVKQPSEHGDRGAP